MSHRVSLLVWIFAVSLAAQGVLAQPANDDCAAATTLAVGDVVTDSSVDATPSVPPPCGSNATLDVWFTFTATATEHVNVSLCGSTFDTALTIYDACGGTELACSDNSAACGQQSELPFFPVVAGEDYVIRIAGNEGVVGDYTLSLTARTPPVNDDCAGAIALADNDTVNGNNNTSTASGVLASCSDDDYYDVWYSYTATADKFVNFSLCGSALDTTLSIFDACGGAQLACNDDYTGCGYASQLNCFEVLNGETYLVRIAGYQGASGAFALALSDCAAPANDLCANAIALEEGVPLDGTTQFAGGTDITTGCGTNDARDVWYSFTPAADMTAAFSLCGSALDTTLAVFDGCGGAELACNDNGVVCGPLASHVPALSLTGGTPYLVRVAGENLQRGDFTLTVADNTPPTVSSIARAETGPTSQSDVYFYVYFDRPVQGFDSADDLVITANGVTYGGVEITTSDDAYDVRVYGLDGQGSLSIAVNTSSDVRSLVEIPLATSVVSDPILIDHVPPVLSQVSLSEATAHPGDLVGITFDASEDLAYIEVTVNGVEAEAAKSLYGFEYLVSLADPEGPALLEIYAEDAAGNGEQYTNANAFTVDYITVPISPVGAALALAVAGGYLLRRKRPRHQPHAE